MNKAEFMRELEKSLGTLDECEKRDILYDYEEHFNIGFEKGKKEEEITKELGDPEAIGKSYRASSAVDEVLVNPTTKNIGRAILAAVALGMFNLIVVIGPLLGIVGVILGLFGSAISIFIAGIALVLAAITKPLLNSYINIGMNPIAAIFFGIGTTALGMLFFIGVVYISKSFYKLIGKYLKWNLDIIRK